LFFFLPFLIYGLTFSFCGIYDDHLVGYCFGCCIAMSFDLLAFLYIITTF